MKDICNATDLVDLLDIGTEQLVLEGTVIVHKGTITEHRMPEKMVLEQLLLKAYVIGREAGAKEKG